MKMNKKAMSTSVTSWIIDLVILAFLLASFFAVNIKLKDNTNHILKISALDYSYIRAVSIIPSKNKELNYFFVYDPKIDLSFSKPCLIKAVPKNKAAENYAAFNCVLSNKFITEDFLDNKIVVDSK